MLVVLLSVEPSTRPRLSILASDRLHCAFLMYGISVWHIKKERNGRTTLLTSCSLSQPKSDGPIENIPKRAKTSVMSELTKKFPVRTTMDFGRKGRGGVRSGGMAKMGRRDSELF